MPPTTPAPPPPDDRVGPVQIALPGVDPERLMLAGVDVSERPLFTIKQVGWTFFGLTNYWVRDLERKHLFDVEGVDGQGRPLTLYRRTEAGARRFDLASVEQMVHRLAAPRVDARGRARGGVIDGEQAARSLAVVAGIARVWGYLPDAAGEARRVRVERRAALADLRSEAAGRDQVPAALVLSALDELDRLESEL